MRVSGTYDSAVPVIPIPIPVSISISISILVPIRIPLKACQSLLFSCRCCGTTAAEGRLVMTGFSSLLLLVTVTAADAADGMVWQLADFATVFWRLAIKKFLFAVGHLLAAAHDVDDTYIHSLQIVLTSCWTFRGRCVVGILYRWWSSCRCQARPGFTQHRKAVVGPKGAPRGTETPWCLFPALRHRRDSRGTRECSRLRRTLGWVHLLGRHFLV